MSNHKKLERLYGRLTDENKSIHINLIIVTKRPNCRIYSLYQGFILKEKIYGNFSAEELEDIIEQFENKYMFKTKIWISQKNLAFIFEGTKFDFRLNQPIQKKTVNFTDYFTNRYRRKR